MKTFLVSLLINTLLLPLAQADTELAAQRFADYWNAGDDRAAQNEAVFTKEYLQRRGADSLASIMNMVYADNGEITLEDINSPDNKSVEMKVSSQKGHWLQISLDVSEDSKVAGMGVQMIDPPSDASEKGLSDAQISDTLSQYMDARVAAGEFSGSVALAKNGELLFARAYGLADTGTGAKNTLDTPINLGSMNKMFTGLAIAQLVAEGKLAYTDKVGQYLPEYPNQQVRDEVTIHQLLTHTSGIGSYWNDAYMENKNTLQSVDDFAALITDQPLVAEPGAGFNYSNGGPVVLGLIIEKVTGQDYYDYVQTHIYDPAGMVHSGHFDKSENISGKATGYFVPHETGASEMISNFEDLGRIGSPAGGGYASANDLLAFAAALYDGSLLDAKHREEMTSYKVKMGPDDGYAYLYGDFRANGERYIGHNGGAPGINAEFAVFPDSGYVIVVLSNIGENASPVADKIKDWVAFRN